jgi:hypothetical protein
MMIFMGFADAIGRENLVTDLAAALERARSCDATPLPAD